MHCCYKRKTEKLTVTTTAKNRTLWASSSTVARQTDLTTLCLTDLQLTAEGMHLPSQLPLHSCTVTETVSESVYRKSN
jgi:hypothetical protein